MAKKKSRYNVKNGNGYDQLLFETVMSQVIDAPIKSLERSTAYKENDICCEATLPKGGFLICTTAGTTTNTVPTAFSTAVQGATITDGTAKFTVHYFEQLVSFNNVFSGSTSSSSGTSGIVPAPNAGEENLSLLANGKFCILPVSGGGTGANNAVAARTNLGIDTLTGFNPVGSIIAFAGNTLPKGYLLCDGSNISRTTYKDLFDVIGTTYGTGNGSTTFTLPNLIDRFIEGSSVAGIYVEQGLPNITGLFKYFTAPLPESERQNYKAHQYGALYWGTGGLSDWSASMLVSKSLSDDKFQVADPAFNASFSNSIYGNSNTVQPNSLQCQYLIKY